MTTRSCNTGTSTRSVLTNSGGAPSPGPSHAASASAMASAAATGRGTRKEALQRRCHLGLGSSGKIAARKRAGAGGTSHFFNRLSSSESDSSSRSNGSIFISYLPVCRQAPAQALSRPVQARLDGADVVADDVGNLFERKALIFKENQGSLLERRRAGTPPSPA